jgi:hypothetical protein
MTFIRVIWAQVTCVCCDEFLQRSCILWKYADCCVITACETECSGTEAGWWGYWDWKIKCMWISNYNIILCLRIVAWWTHTYRCCVYLNMFVFWCIMTYICVIWAQVTCVCCDKFLQWSCILTLKIHWLLCDNSLQRSVDYLMLNSQRHRGWQMRWLKLFRKIW